MEAYSQAVKYVRSTKGILQQYSHMPSFKAIQGECNDIVKKINCNVKTRNC